MQLITIIFEVDATVIFELVIVPEADNAKGVARLLPLCRVRAKLGELDVACCFDVSDKLWHRVLCINKQIDAPGHASLLRIQSRQVISITNDAHTIELSTGNAGNTTQAALSFHGCQT